MKQLVVITVLITAWLPRLEVVTTFAELLMTMMVTQKNNKSGWMDPCGDWDRMEATECLGALKQVKKQGKMGNLGL